MKLDLEYLHKVFQRYTPFPVEDHEAYHLAMKMLEENKSVPAETLVMPKIAEIKKEYETFIGKQLGTDDKDDWGKVIYIDFEGLWSWIEKKLSNFTA